MDIVVLVEYVMHNFQTLTLRYVKINDNVVDFKKTSSSAIADRPCDCLRPKSSLCSC